MRLSSKEKVECSKRHWIISVENQKRRVTKKKNGFLDQEKFQRNYGAASYFLSLFLHFMRWNEIISQWFFFFKKKLSEISDKHDDVQQESIHAELFSHKFNLKYKTRKKIKERLKKLKINKRTWNFSMTHIGVRVSGH